MSYECPWYWELLHHTCFVTIISAVCVLYSAIISYGYTFWKWEKKNIIVIPLMVMAFVCLSIGSVIVYEFLTGHV